MNSNVTGTRWINYKPDKNGYTKPAEIIGINDKGSSSNLVVISFLFQLSSSFLILLKVVDMFAF